MTRADRPPLAEAARKRLVALSSRGAVASHVRAFDGSVRMIGRAGIPFVLQRSSSFDALAYVCRRLARRSRYHFVERHRGHIDVQVDAIEKRSRQLSDVACDGGVVATAVARPITSEAARTRIHRCDERESRRIHERSGRTRDGYGTFFERLAHHFERRTREFGEFVEK